jgi:hypothetical protein
MQKVLDSGGGGREKERRKEGGRREGRKEGRKEGRGTCEAEVGGLRT